MTQKGGGFWTEAARAPTLLLQFHARATSMIRVGWFTIATKHGANDLQQTATPETRSCPQRCCRKCRAQHRPMHTARTAGSTAKLRNVSDILLISNIISN